MANTVHEQPRHSGFLRCALAELLIIVQERSVIVISVMFFSMSILFALIDTNSETLTNSGFSPVQAIDITASLGTAFLAYAIPLIASQSIAKENDSGIAKLIYATYPRFWHRLICATLGIIVWAWALFMLCYGAAFLTVILATPSPPLPANLNDFQPLAISLFGRLFGFAALAGLGVGVAALLKRVSTALTLLITVLFIFPLAAQMLRGPLPFVTHIARWLPMPTYNRLAEAGLYSSESFTSIVILYATMCTWAVGLLGFASWRITKQDIC